ncbi:MAG TPA: Ig-like domain-containing protein, partial [Pyrinomonadaceae bacterium]|nr:Ig-like domain-containing protein [Pyrinomonadaceae bacterium]
ADVDGTMIDVYQAATQITDESGQTYSTHINSLLDNALGSSGYYGVFTVNMHTDSSNYPSAESPHSGAIAIVDSAKSRGVPVVSAKQMLTWLDGRNNSTIGITSWNGGILSFNINAAPGSTDLTSMIPTVSNAGNLVAMTKDGSPISYITETVKGVQYAFFASETGGYTATYSADVIAPTVVSVTPTDSATDVAVNTSPTATFNEAMDPVTINSTSVELRDGSDNLVPAATSFAGNTVTIDPNEPLSGSSTYSVTIKSGSGGARDVAGNPLATDFTWSFTTTTANPYNCPCSVWSDSPDLPTDPNGFDPGHTIETGVKFRAAIDGYITGVRFYKGTSNTGTHVGHLWSSSGVKLAEATFTGESASGWQTVTFAPAVAVTANTTYVASYYSSSGYFAYTGGGLSTSISNGPITLLAAGTDGANGVYLYDPAAPGGFPSSGSNANYWIDVVFNTDPGDTTPPQITSRYPAANDYGVPLSANVTVTFNEAMNLSTINGTTMRLRKDGGLVDIPAVVSGAGLNATLNPAGPLDPNAVYRVTVSASVADTSNNPIGSDVSWTFVTAPTEFTDWSAEHFTAGTSESTHVALETDGEVILTPTVGDEFAGTALDAQWVTHLWSAGGSASVEAGQLISNGSRIGTVNTFAAGRSLEFVATFGAATFQHVGFGVDYENPPLAIFSTFNTTNQLFARTNNGVATVDTPLGNLIGSPHRYRIEWLPTSVAYYVDDVLVATHNVPIAVELRPLISDFEDSQPGVSVDWIRMSEFASQGTFVSRVFDSGDQAEWMQLVFNADLPFGTSITLETRSGDTPLPDGSWSGWLPTSGASIESGDARYLQYRAVLTSSLSSITPTLFDVSLSYRTLAPTAADVVVSGRVLSRSGRPIQRAIVQLVDQTGNVQRVTTNTLGYYRFDGISAESMVVLSASSRRYTFETRLIRVSDSIYDLEIIGIDR